MATDRPYGHAPFRITDEVYLVYHPAQADGAAPGWGEGARRVCHGLLQLRELTLQGHHLLAGIRKHHPDIGHYLALQERKLELLGQLVATQAMGGEITPNHRVTLRSEGMGFTAPLPQTVGSALQLRMVLFPSHLCLQLGARVSRCTQEGAGYLIELTFDGLEEAEQDALIRHMTERQSAARRRELEG